MDNTTTAPPENGGAWERITGADGRLVYWKRSLAPNEYLTVARIKEGPDYNAGRYDALNAERRLSPSAVQRKIDRAIAASKPEVEQYWRGYLSVVAR